MADAAAADHLNGQLKGQWKGRLKGSIPPLVTPFKNGEVDYDAYARLVALQIEKGSHGILVNGTTSEPATLTVEERNKLVDIALAVTAKRVPVVAATGSQSLAETKQLTEHAAKAGADALLIVTPYYTRPPQRGLVAYYLELAKISDLPWMVYHIPGRTAVGVTLDTLKELKAKSPDICGDEARRQRSRFCFRMPGHVRPGFQNFRRP